MSKQKIVTVPALDHDAMMLKRFGREVGACGKLERGIVYALCKHLIAAGFAIKGVWDGEVFEKAETPKAAMEFIFNLDEASLRITKGKREHGVLLILGNGEDVISDYNYSEGDSDGFRAAMEAFDYGQGYVFIPGKPKAAATA